MVRQALDGVSVLSYEDPYIVRPSPVRPDIAYATKELFRHLSDPIEEDEVMSGFVEVRLVVWHGPMCPSHRRTRTMSCPCRVALSATPRKPSAQQSTLWRIHRPGYTWNDAWAGEARATVASTGALLRSPSQQKRARSHRGGGSNICIKVCIMVAAQALALEHPAACER